MGAKPTTLTGLSGSGDIMLTCFVNLSRNRTVGLRLGSGEKLDDILSSMNQVSNIPSVCPYLLVTFTYIPLQNYLFTGANMRLDDFATIYM